MYKPRSKEYNSENKNIVKGSRNNYILHLLIAA